MGGGLKGFSFSEGSAGGSSSDIAPFPDLLRAVPAGRRGCAYGVGLPSGLLDAFLFDLGGDDFHHGSRIGEQIL